MGKDGKFRKSPSSKTKAAPSSSPSPEQASNTATAPEEKTGPADQNQPDAKSTASGESYELADKQEVLLPLDGGLTPTQLKFGLGRLKIVAKQMGNGTMNAGLCSKLQRDFLKITAAVFEVTGPDADPEERAAIVEVLKALADIVADSVR